MSIIDQLIRARRYAKWAKRPPTKKAILAMVLTTLAGKLIRKVLRGR